MAILSTSANIATPGLPVGSIQAFAGANAPTGWLLCDGSAVSRGNYPDLYSVLGTTYGSGDGSTTFNLPDLRGRVPAGKDNMGGTAANRLTTAVSGVAGTALGTSGGNESMQSHYHNYYRVTTSGGAVGTGGDIIWAVSGGNVVDKAGFGYLRTDTIGSNTGTGSSQNVQPTLVVNYIIKAIADIARGGWYTQSSPPVVTQLPTNPAIGEEVYHYVSNKIYQKRYNGSAWESLINANSVDLPTGAVVQAVTRTSSANNSSFNGFIYSDCYCYITPLFSTSRILVMASASVWHSSGGDSGYGGGIYSNVGGQLIQISRVGHGYAGASGAGCFNGISYLASPNTTSNHYYQLTLDAYRNNQGTTVQLNRSYQQTDYSTMTLLEIR